MTTSFPTLKTERLLLRQITSEDQSLVFKGLSHPEVIKYYEVSYLTLEATKEQMDWYAGLEKDGTGLFWAICSADNSTFYGVGGIYDLTQAHKKAEIGFWLLPEHWGRGYMQEAFAAMEDYCFNTLKLHRLEGYVEAGNDKCVSAITKVGYELEGTMKDSEMKNGQFISVHIFAKVHG